MLLNLKKYHRPKSIPEAINLLRKNTKTGAAIAGGTYIVPLGDRSITELVDITDLGLSYIKNDKDKVRIGATTTIQEIMDSQEIGKLAQGVITESARATTVSKMIRNVSTIGGEIANASLYSSLVLVLMALDSQVKIVGETEHEMPIREFFVGNRAPTFKGKLITEIQIPQMEANTGTSFIRLAMIQSSVPIVSVASLLTVQNGLCKKARIAIGAATTTIVRMMQAEKLLEGQKIDDKLIEAASKKVADIIEPISDARASADYRKEMSRVLTRRSLQESFEKVAAG